MKSLELIMTIHVVTEDAIALHSDDGQSVIMIPFSGYVTGPMFNGEIQKGGVDTQIIHHASQHHTLSARYILSGEDKSGQKCMIYIENNGRIHQSTENQSYLFRTYPQIITSSHTLKHLEQEILLEEGKPTQSGVNIEIYIVR